MLSVDGVDEGERPTAKMRSTRQEKWRVSSENVTPPLVV
tara:strand:- start:16240 stop:16356 length:117 start_codon:yes stop_codon:yes gene_type:complete